MSRRHCSTVDCSAAATRPRRRKSSSVGDFLTTIYRRSMGIGRVGFYRRSPGLRCTNAHHVLVTPIYSPTKTLHAGLRNASAAKTLGNVDRSRGARLRQTLCRQHGLPMRCSHLSNPSCSTFLRGFTHSLRLSVCSICVSVWLTWRKRLNSAGDTRRGSERLCTGGRRV